MDYLNSVDGVLRVLCSQLKVKPEEVGGRVAGLVEELRAAQKAVGELSSQLAVAKSGGVGVWECSKGGFRVFQLSRGGTQRLVLLQLEVQSTRNDSPTRLEPYSSLPLQCPAQPPW